MALEGQARKDYAKQHYLDNKEMYFKAAKALGKRKRDFINDLKSRTPCVDCKQYFPFYVMQFDHVIGEKLFNIGNKCEQVGWATLKAEIAKCEIICGNCHLTRSYLRVRNKKGK